MFSCKFEIRFIYVNVVSRLILLNCCSNEKGVWVFGLDVSKLSVASKCYVRCKILML
jgi:hypothetical protein